MYNAVKDKGENVNLVETMPDEAARLGQLLDEYIAEVGGDVTIQTD